MAYQISLPFSSKDPTIMHIDLNSCFASVEQQANPLLRGKPIAVAAYTTPSGCILAPSVEAKVLGIKVGMRVKEGKMICPNLIVLPPDPWKYRTVHLQLRDLLNDYSNDVVPRSIDEFVINFEGYPAFQKGMSNLGREIKNRIKSEIGDWLRVSIGIGPNRFLAKTGAGLKKPDGLDVIDINNYRQVYEKLKLTDLCGIERHLATRLNAVDIHTVIDFYDADIPKIRSAFHSICAYYWHLRLHGWEIDDVEFGRKSFGNSYSLPQTLMCGEAVTPILMKLTEKTCARLRSGGFIARGVHLAVIFCDGGFWHKGISSEEGLYDTRDIYRRAYKLLRQCPYQKVVRNIAISCYNLEKRKSDQLALFADVEKKHNLVAAIDAINEKWGDFVITPALMMGLDDKVIDRVSFGGVKDLESFITGEH